MGTGISLSTIGIDAPTLVDFAGDDYIGGAVQSGLLVALEADGGQPRGRADQALQLGEHRVVDAPTGPYLLVQVGSTVPPPSFRNDVSSRV